MLLIGFGWGFAVPSWGSLVSWAYGEWLALDRSSISFRRGSLFEMIFKTLVGRTIGTLNYSYSRDKLNGSLLTLRWGWLPAIKGRSACYEGLFNIDRGWEWIRPPPYVLPGVGVGVYEYSVWLPHKNRKNMRSSLTRRKELSICWSYELLSLVYAPRFTSTCCSSIIALSKVELSAGICSLLLLRLVAFSTRNSSVIISLNLARCCLTFSSLYFSKQWHDSISSLTSPDNQARFISCLPFWGLTWADLVFKVFNFSEIIRFPSLAVLQGIIRQIWGRCLIPKVLSELNY